MESLIIPLKIYMFAMVFSYTLKQVAERTINPMVFSYTLKQVAERTINPKELLSWIAEGKNAYITSITVLQGFGMVAEKIGLLYFIIELARL